MSDQDLVGLMEPIEFGFFLILRLFVFVVASFLASKFIGVLVHRRDYQDGHKWRSDGIVWGTAYFVTLLLFELWGPLSDGRFLATLYSGELLTLLVGVAPAVGADLPLTLAIGLILALVKA